MNYRYVVWRFLEELSSAKHTNAEGRLNLLRLAWLEAACQTHEMSNENGKYELVYTDLLKYMYCSTSKTNTTLGRLQAFDLIVNPAINDKGLSAKELYHMMTGYHQKKKIL